jgi:3-dehydroquinate synthase
METVHVDLAGRSYDILIGPGLIGRAGGLVGPLLPRPFTVIVTDETVAGLHLEPLKAGLAESGVQAEAIVLPPGEATKSMAKLTQVVERLLELKVERDDLVIALGGGVIGDLAGFAAAVLRRGVDFVQVPTSLLAQVDSSVGGKTGVNSSHGKNLIGAFHQPRLVLADTDVLETLPPRDFLAGYGEVAKYGLLGDAGFFDWLEKNAPAMRDGDRDARIHAVRRSCEIKAGIVARDEHERGDRALLNLGHTFGHALEAATGYSARLLSARMGLCSQECPSRVRAHLGQMGMKKDLADIEGDLPDVDGLMALMGQDKKVRQGQLTFILARGIGEAFVEQNADLAVVRGVLGDALRGR